MNKVQIIEICIPCNGVGKLGGFFNKTPTHHCPWCNEVGKVDSQTNDLFLRVAKKLPGPNRSCSVFGTWKDNE